MTIEICNAIQLIFLPAAVAEETVKKQHNDMRSIELMTL